MKLGTEHAGEGGFACPDCGARMMTTDSRPSTYRKKRTVRRRRSCIQCHRRVTTFEVINSIEEPSGLEIPEVMASARMARDALAGLIADFENQKADEP